MQIQHRRTAIREGKAHIRDLPHIPAGHIQCRQGLTVCEDALQRSDIGCIPPGHIQRRKSAASMEHTVRRFQTLGVPVAQVQTGQAIGIVEHIPCRGDFAHIPILDTHDLLGAFLRHLHGQRVSGPVSIALLQIRLRKRMPVFHGRGVAGIVQRGVDGLNILHIAKEPIGIGVGHDLHTICGDDQGAVVFQPRDNRLIPRCGNIPHVAVCFHQSTRIGRLHVGNGIVPIGILKHNALDLSPVFRSMEVHIAVIIRRQGRCIQRLRHTVSGPGIVIAANNRRHPPLIRDPVIALRNGILTHDLRRHIGVYIEGARSAACSWERNACVFRLLKGNDCQLIDMSEGHGIKACQCRRQRQRRDAYIIESPLPYRHQALRQSKTGNQLEIRERIVPNGCHALHKGKAICLVLIVGPLRIRLGGKVLHGTGIVVKGKFEFDPVLTGGILVCQITHKGLAVLVCNRGSSPADLHAVIQLVGGIQVRATEFLCKPGSIHPYDHLFKGEVDTPCGLEGCGNMQGQLS